MKNMTEWDAKVENIVININKEKEKKCTSHVRCGYNAYLISTKVLVDFHFKEKKINFGFWPLLYLLGSINYIFLVEFDFNIEELKLILDIHNLTLLIVIVICLWQNIQFQHITFTIHTMGSPITEIRKRVSNNNKQNIYSWNNSSKSPNGTKRDNP